MLWISLIILIVSCTMVAYEHFHTHPLMDWVYDDIPMKPENKAKYFEKVSIDDGPVKFVSCSPLVMETKNYGNGSSGKIGKTVTGWGYD